MISRRNMLMALVSVAASSALPASTTVPSSTLSDRKPASGKPGKGLPWRNWSGSQTCYPQVRKAPATIGELQELITSSKGVIRPVGAGHSFSALVPAWEVWVSPWKISARPCGPTLRGLSAFATPCPSDY